MGKLLRKAAALWHTLAPVHYTYPAMDIFLPGDRALHLVGSIHMGTRDIQPLPAPLLQHINNADALIVEADIRHAASPFSHSETHPPLSERLSHESLRILTRICDELALSNEIIDRVPGWQVALMIQVQQAQRLGLRPDYGIDYQLLQVAAARGLPIIELEGPDEQLKLLRTLPNNGMLLLQDTLDHWHTNAQLLQTMVSWWLENSTEQRQMTLENTFSHELNEVLMSQRNQRWNTMLRALSAGHYVVAVGAMHLYGADNLPALLKVR